MKVNAHILNAGLQFAMEWGDPGAQPIQPRLQKSFPHVSESELNEVDRLCRKALERAYALAESASRGLKVSKPFFQKDIDALHKAERHFQMLKEQFPDELRKDFPWIEDATLEQLFSQGCYHAMK